MLRAVWPEEMNSLFRGGREIPWGSGLGPDGKDLEHRDEKCELYSREMKFFKLRRDNYTVGCMERLEGQSWKDP